MSEQEVNNEHVDIHAGKAPFGANGWHFRRNRWHKIIKLDKPPISKGTWNAGFGGIEGLCGQFYSYLEDLDCNLKWTLTPATPVLKVTENDKISCLYLISESMSTWHKVVKLVTKAQVIKCINQASEHPSFTVYIMQVLGQLQKRYFFLIWTYRVRGECCWNFKA